MAMMDLHWRDAELPDSVYHRRLETEKGDVTLRGLKGLPIQRQRATIVDGIWNSKVVAIEASTGSGKTMKVPEYIFDVLTTKFPSGRKFPSKNITFTVTVIIV